MIPKILFWSGVTLTVIDTIASLHSDNYNLRKVELALPFLFFGGAAVAKYLGM